MARRNRDSAADDGMARVARLPWWAGVGLALGLYLALHHFAALPAEASGNPSDTGPLLAPSLWRTLAGLGQYLLPALCLAGAARSAWRRRQRQALQKAQTHHPAAEALAEMSWQAFERLVSQAFRLQGFNVQETGLGGPDGGVDLVLRRSGERHLVLCRQWQTFQVGAEAVRELYGVMAAQGAAGGFVLTAGHFTDEARLFASGRNIQLVEGPVLMAWLRQAAAALSARQASQAAASHGPAPARPGALICPLCGLAMVRRKSRHGTHGGREFWGCMGYPGCKGTLPEEYRQSA